LRQIDCSATSGGPKLGGKLRQYRIALAIGTRPEAIKLAPVARALSDMGEIPLLCLTGQHPGLELSEHGLDAFEHFGLDCPGQPDPMLHAEWVRASLCRQMPEPAPRLIVVHGDTSSALGAALAARDRQIALAHVEAGLRSHDLSQPWPEEENRVRIDAMADILFAPTVANALNLRTERVDGDVFITGNSGIDALAGIVGALPRQPRRRWPMRTGFRLLVTCHRRENWNGGLDRLITALILLAGDGVLSDVLMPPNPGVTEQLIHHLARKRGIRLLPPLSHRATIEAMCRADLVLSDSGGMQEEARALGVPLLVLREKTERPEALTEGTVQLVGTDADRIVATVRRLRRDRAALREMGTASLPFGDGRASPRIAFHCIEFVDALDSGSLSRRA